MLTNDLHSDFCYTSFPLALFTTHICLTAAFSLCIAVTFARALLSMRSPFKRTDKVLFGILIRSLISNVAISGLTIITAVLFIFSKDAKFQVTLSILATTYPIVLLSALLARDSTRESLGEPLAARELVESGFRADVNDPEMGQGRNITNVIGKSSLEKKTQPLIF